MANAANSSDIDNGAPPLVLEREEREHRPRRSKLVLELDDVLSNSHCPKLFQHPLWRCWCPLPMVIPKRSTSRDEIPWDINQEINISI
eukprot:scaffold45057_cov70-Attheya_sp.AAC.1